MATGAPIKELCEEVTCPICLEYFRDPVILAECGHNFCRVCLTRSWLEAEAEEASCPVCKQTAQPRNLLPNRQLANIVGITRKLSFERGEASKEEARERICAKHQKPLKLFCRIDEILICSVCDRSKEHIIHAVIPAEEASWEYKDRIFSCLETLSTEREKILLYLAEAEEESQAVLENMELMSQESVALFRILHQMLNKEENCLLAWVEETKKDIARKGDKYLARLSEELSCLESLMHEMEKKHRQPASELLQDIRSTLQRYEKKETFQNPEVSPFTWSVYNCRYDIFLASAVIQLKGILEWAFLKPKATVIPDPGSANSCLVVYGNERIMKWQSTADDLSEDPEKCYGFVLGSEGFTAGCHFWEVHVAGDEGWAVGVARKPVKDRVTFTPEEGIWAVGRWKGQYKAFIKGADPPLALSEQLICIRVCLNHKERRVAFFNVSGATLLYEFSEASFSDVTLYPLFAVYGDGQLWIEN
ncbi:UNVERIFIED_CONTAM: hypothetical protein K2H54_061131 [Gekko kuhli]